MKNNNPTFFQKLKNSAWLEIIIILAIAAIVYLPGLMQATVYRDDWYYIMDRLIGGPGAFQEMFRIDRPARGPFFEAYYLAFGYQPLPYHLFSYLWRALGGLAAFWLFRQLWPRQRMAVFLMGLMFALYPGYLRWLEGFENQPRILSSLLQTLSIALTLKAIRSTQMTAKILAWTASILSGWAYIALLDFAIGMEFFRLLCVFVLVNQEKTELTWLKKGINTLRAWSVAALIPGIFLLWRLLIFDNERPATDVGLQVGALFSSPALTGGWWLVHALQSFVNAAILSWVAPLFQNLFAFTLSDALAGLLLATLVAGLAAWICAQLDQTSGAPEEEASSGRWQKEALLLGLLGGVVGVLPVIIANRYVTFGGYSHYALPSSLAAAALVIGALYSLQSKTSRLIAASTLVLFATLTHYAVTLQILQEERTIQAFWQQMAWRAPGIEAGTTLVVAYPGLNYAEDVDAVAGPANFIYFPTQTNQIPATYPLLALPQMEYAVQDALAGGDKPYGYRTHIGQMNYDKLLVISQPSSAACVHVIDAQWPRHSEQDTPIILLTGERSKIENLRTSGDLPRLPVAMFGPEPAHTWCYYYQKAELALQKRDWAEVARLGNEATRQKLNPGDRVEWAPFLQAYAVLGDEQAFKTTVVKLDTSLFMRQQVCRAVLATEKIAGPFSVKMQSLVEEKLCRGQAKP